MLASRSIGTTLGIPLAWRWLTRERPYCTMPSSKKLQRVLFAGTPLKLCSSHPREWPEGAFACEGVIPYTRRAGSYKIKCTSPNSCHT